MLAAELLALLALCVPRTPHQLYILGTFTCQFSPVFARLSVCTPRCLHASVFACLSVCTPQCLHTSVFACLSACMPQCMHASVFARLSVCTPQCLHTTCKSTLSFVQGSFTGGTKSPIALLPSSPLPYCSLIAPDKQRQALSFWLLSMSLA